MSVRPGSRLTIDSYHYDAVRPKETAIRFRLEEGVARALSGKGAEGAPRPAMREPTAAHIR